MNNCNKTHGEIEKFLIGEKKLRFTSLRKKVFDIISKNQKPIKAYDILDILQKKDPSAKPPTVYRTLDFLLENSLVHKLHSSNSYVACSNPDKQHDQCYFLTCDKCNKTQELKNNDLISKQINNIALDSNFQIRNISIEIGGVCHSCE